MEGSAYGWGVPPGAGLFASSVVALRCRPVAPSTLTPSSLPPPQPQTPSASNAASAPTKMRPWGAEPGSGAAWVPHFRLSLWLLGATRRRTQALPCDGSRIVDPCCRRRRHSGNAEKLSNLPPPLMQKAFRSVFLVFFTQLCTAAVGGCRRKTKALSYTAATSCQNLSSPWRTAPRWGIPWVGFGASAPTVRGSINCQARQA
jgi:hypothetical protein